MIKEPVAGNQLRTKVISVNYFLTSNYGWESLETRIEKFINSEPMEILDIQYSTNNIHEDASYGRCSQDYIQRSAMIIYKLK